MNIQQQQAALSALPTDQTAIPILQRIAQGQHPMFPPGTEWMGLAKMNEVKRSMEAAQAMQQAAMAGQQAPTVRDQVQQGVASLAQQQMQTQQGQMAMAAQQAPQRMAAGGIARYAEGGVMGDIPGYREDKALQAYLQQEAAPEEEMRFLPALWEALKQGTTVDEIRRGQGRAPFVNTDKQRDELRRIEAGYKEGKGDDKKKSPVKQDNTAWDPTKESVWKGGRVPAGQVRSWAQGNDPEASALLAAYLKKFPDAAEALNAPPAAPAQGGIASVAPRGSASDVGIATLPAAGPAPAPRSVGDYPTYTPELPEDPTVARKALMAGEPALQGDPMADRKAYAEKMAQREAALRARFAEADPQMQREAWTRKLLAAANAAGSQGGMRGIASALGGFAEQSAREGQYERKVASERIGQQEKLEDLRIQFEMETRAGERAAAEGRIAEALKHRENVARIKEEARKLAYQGQVDKYKLDRESEDRHLDRVNRLEQQRLANQGSLAAATARTGDGTDKTVRAMTAVQQVLNNNPEYKELAKTASMAPNSSMGQKAAARMRAIEQEIIGRFAPELLESVGASKPAAPDLSKWGQPKLVQ